MSTTIDPSTLKITDMRFADIDGAPKRCTLIKIYTNQGLIGYGEVRDASSRTYAAMLKSRILYENPCDVERSSMIKQFGGHSRQAGGVCGIEVALWDLAGKAWGVPVWQLLGGKFRDTVRIYCDTDSEGGGRDMGKALKERMAQGFTYLKMDLGIELLMDKPGCLSAPGGFLETMRHYKKTVFSTPHSSIDPRAMRGKRTTSSALPTPSPVSTSPSRGSTSSSSIWPTCALKSVTRSRSPSTTSVMFRWKTASNWLSVWRSSIWRGWKTRCRGN